MPKNYNTTDLSPDTAFERHVFHRDQFAHYLRWSFILNKARIGESIVDFGCGKGNLLEVLYRNKFKQKKYIGIDIRSKTIDKASEKFKNVKWAEFLAMDLVKEPYKSFTKFKADKVCSFEVMEHVGKNNAHDFLLRFMLCGKKGATYYISTPNYDEKVGAAGNHTYDSGDGRGVAIQEFSYKELETIFEEYFDVINAFGTFASVRDYKEHMTTPQKIMFNDLKKYYDSNLISNIMATMFPQYSRNTLWVLKIKPEIYAVLKKEFKL